MVLFAFVMTAGQVLLASHDAHDLASPSERASCAICVLGHGFDTTLVSAAALPMPAAVNWFDWPEAGSTLDDQFITGYRARGPPSPEVTC